MEKEHFSIAKGQMWRRFIKELTNLLNHFVNKTPWQRLSLLLVHVFIPIMLQKPSSKSKPRDHSKYLTSRLERWRNGQLESLMDEAREIQRRIKTKASPDKTEANQKAFVNLMLMGKLGDAAKKINNDDSIKGVHSLDDNIKAILQKKHIYKYFVLHGFLLLPHILNGHK